MSLNSSPLFPLPLRRAGRFAPTPTGPLHVGNAYAALLSWVASRAAGEAQLLRIDDLDLRSLPQGCLAGQLEDLAWLGLSYDEGDREGGPNGPYRQSARGAYYRRALELLNERGLLYPCDCSRRELAALAPHGDGGPVYPGLCRPAEPQPLPSLDELPAPRGRPPALRLNLHAAAPLLRELWGQSEGPIEVCFRDKIQGDQCYLLLEELGDFVLRRGDGVYAYQLACAIDDAVQCGGGLIVRGADLLSSTARQLTLLTLFGLPIPRYAHCALIVDEGGERLAKRRRSTTLSGLREAGVSSATLRASLATLWGGPADAELERQVERFSIEELPRGPVSWSQSQLF